MRIAIFSEVYWPMVSAASGSHSERLVNALHARGHQVRIYTATYRALPPGERDRPEVAPFAQHSALPLSGRAVGLPPPKRGGGRPGPLQSRRGPCGHRVRPRAGRSEGRAGSWALAGDRLGSHRLSQVRRAVRGSLGPQDGLDLSPLVLRPRAEGPGTLTLLPGARCGRNGVDHTGLWTRGVDPLQFPSPLPERGYRERFGVGPE